MAKFRNIAIAAAVALAAPAVAYFEGTRLVAYLDPVGVPTICSGATEGVTLGQVKTAIQCDQMLQRDLERFAQGVDDMVTVYLPPARHAALTSFAYNVGLGAFSSSTLLRHLNAGRTQAACDQLLRWTYARGVQWPGLVKRRAAERDMCLREGL